MNKQERITRRTRIPGTQKRNQIDKFKVQVYKISGDQEKFKERLIGIIRQIFGSYKENSFKNDQNLKLLKLFRLLRNISRKDLGFVQALQQKKEQVIDFIQYNVEKIIQDEKTVYEGDVNKVKDGIDWDTFKEKTVKDICKIFQDSIDKISGEIPDTNQESNNKEKTLELAKKFKELENAVSTELLKKEKDDDYANQETPKTPKTNQEKIPDLNRRTIGYQKSENKLKTPKIFKRTYKDPYVKKLNRKNHSNITNDNKIRIVPRNFKIGADNKKLFKVNKIFRLPKKELKKIRGVFNKRLIIDEERTKNEFNGVNNKINKKIRQMSFMGLVGGLMKGAIGVAGAGLGLAKNFLLHGFGIQTVFSGATALFKTGAFALTSVYNIGKFAIFQTFSLVKGAVSAVLGLSSFVIKTLKKPILNSIRVLMFSPQAMFTMGLLIGGIAGKLKTLFDDKQEDLKEITKSIRETFIGIKNFFNDSPLQKVKELYDSIKDNLAEGLEEFIQLLNNFIVPFFPENISKFAVGYAAGATIREITRFIVGKKVGGTLGGAILSKIGLSGAIPFAVAALAVGSFAIMSKELKVINATIAKGYNARVGGLGIMRHHLSKTLITGGDFIIGKGAQRLSKAAEKIKRQGAAADNNPGLQAIRGYTEKIRVKKKYNEDVQFYNKEHAMLEKEILAISKAMVQDKSGSKDVYRDKPRHEYEKKEAIKSKIQYILNDGTTTNFVLVDDPGKIFNFRIGYVLIRNALLMKFINGEITRDQYEKQVKDIIETYNGGYFRLNGKFMNSKFMQLRHTGYRAKKNPWWKGGYEYIQNPGSQGEGDSEYYYGEPYRYNWDFNGPVSTSNDDEAKETDAFTLHGIMAYTFFENSERVKKDTEEKRKQVSEETQDALVSAKDSFVKGTFRHANNRFHLLNIIYRVYKQNYKSSINSCADFFISMIKDRVMQNTIKDMVSRKIIKNISVEDIQYALSKIDLLEEYIKAACLDKKQLESYTNNLLSFMGENRIDYFLMEKSNSFPANGELYTIDYSGDRTCRTPSHDWDLPFVFYEKLEDIVPEYEKVSSPTQKFCVKLYSEENRDQMYSLLRRGYNKYIKWYAKKLRNFIYDSAEKVKGNVNVYFCNGTDDNNMPRSSIKYGFWWKAQSVITLNHGEVPGNYCVRVIYASLGLHKKIMEYITLLVAESIADIIFGFIQLFKNKDGYENSIMGNGGVTDGAQNVFSQQGQSVSETISSMSQNTEADVEKIRKERISRIKGTIEKLKQKTQELRDVGNYISGKDKPGSDKNGGQQGGVPGGKGSNGIGTVTTVEAAEVDTSGQDSEAKSRKHSDERH